MKILLVSAHNFVIPGGVRMHIVNIAEELRNLGHEVDIVAPGYKNIKNKFNTNIKNFYEVGKDLLIKFNGTKADVSYGFQKDLKELLDEKHYDIIHSHNFGPFIGNFIRDYANKYNIPYIITIHSYPKGFAKVPVNSTIFNASFTNVKHIIFVSKSQKDLWNGLKYPASLITNGIRVRDDFSVKSIDNVPQVRIMFIGRDDPKKGLKYLIFAFAKLYEKYNDYIHLDIVGGGSEEMLESLEIDKGIWKNISFHGFKTYDEFIEIGRDAHIFVAPSIGYESFGLILLEGMSMAMPTIGFENEGFKSVLTEEAAWGLVPNKNIDLLAAKIAELIEYKELYKKMSKVSLEHVKKFDWKNITKDIESVYKKYV